MLRHFTHTGPRTQMPETRRPTRTRPDRKAPRIDSLRTCPPENSEWKPIGGDVANQTGFREQRTDANEESHYGARGD